MASVTATMEADANIPEQRAEELSQITRRFRAVERRDWWLWVTAISILLLITAALFVAQIQYGSRLQEFEFWSEIQIASRGMLAVVLLFCVFAISQQVQIKKLRRDLAAHMGVAAALQTRAEVLERMAVIDPLTGLYNRRYFDDRLPGELSRAARQKEPFTLVVLDLNNFKEVNETHGHAAGDLVLREFAGGLKKAIRSSDIPVRLGGDEFLLMLPDCRQYNVPMALARMRGLAVDIAGLKVPVGFSAGWAEYDPGELPDALFRRADAALGDDKNTGRAGREVLQALTNEQHGEKMKAVGHLTGRVAHDFNNLLSVIKGFSDLLLADMEQQDPKRARVQEISRAAARAATLTAQLLSYSHRAPVEAKVLDMNRIAGEVADLVRPLLGPRIALELRLADSVVPVRAAAGQVEQALTNLLTNARDAIGVKGEITLTTRNFEMDAAFVEAHRGSRRGRYVCVAVMDTGCGMDDAIRGRVFEPFFTTKPKGKGTGLGLSNIYGTVKQLGGYVEVVSAPGRGSTFSLFFPEYEAPSHAPEAEMALASGRGPVHLNVLVLEPLSALRTLFCDFLRSAGHVPLEAATIDEGVQMVQTNGVEIHVALTSTALFGAGAEQFFSALTRTGREIHVLYISGHIGASGIESSIPPEAILESPFSAADLDRKLHQVLQAAPMAASANPHTV